MSRVTTAGLLGVMVGAVYLLSPLTVICAIGLVLVLRWAHAVPDATERRWLLALLGSGIALRVVAIAGLFLVTDHQTTPFGRLFGDEEYFIRRSIWLHNIALGIPISLADVRYAYDESIETGFVWLLAGVNLFVGPAPYAIRLVSTLLYLVGALLLYRTVRPTFGRPASLVGLGLLLFLPSLFAWSISVLKEPVFFALLSGVVALTVAAARQPSWMIRLLALTLIGGAAYVADAVREGGLIVAGVGTIGGVLLGFWMARPRLVVLLTTVVLAATPLLMFRGAVQDRVTAEVARAALRHWDHAHAPGHSYMIFEPAFYREPPVAGGMTVRESATLVAGGLTAYVAVPTPGQMQSRAELAYLPEQTIWYAMVLLAPFGLVAALRRDPFAASVLLVHLLVAVALVALTSGNIGTLVRHRALAMPYLVWFSGLGLSVAVAHLSGLSPVPAALSLRNRKRRPDPCP